MVDESEGTPRKRRKLENGQPDTGGDNIKSLKRSISPPPLRNSASGPKIMSSPFQLTRIQDLPASSNVGAVSLKDILGDPMVAECWEFNYLHDLDFLMSAFDEDVRELVKVHVVHGFWKREDASRINLQAQAAKYNNVTLHTAFMPEMFGTHHSKMLILLRHDDLAQVIIHTANMIPFDWANMTQGVWKSPLLPKREVPASLKSDVVGSGAKFKADLLSYLRAYDLKRTICKQLIQALSEHDFSEVRAALVASAPVKQDVEGDPDATAFGWSGLRRVLASVPVASKEPEIVVQISSIATLGVNDKWLDKTLFRTLSTSKNNFMSKPKFHIVFPTPDEIRRSLNGYRSGTAIHVKLQSTTQQKQLQYLQPLFRHWAGDEAATSSSAPRLDAGRKRAAPHIKSYIRFTDSTKTAIDWMLITSANLSKQAWGDATNASGEAKICSYEIGVLVWPELLAGTPNAKMIPTFMTDVPAIEKDTKGDADVVIGTRMPYDLPLIPYAKDEEPWCATKSYDEPDWTGVSYQVVPRN